MTIKIAVTAILAASLVLLPSFPAFAHHGAAIYDPLRTVVLSGTVEQFEYVNPHILIHIAAVGKKGDVQHWVVDMPPPGLAEKIGWSKDMMKPGDKVIYEVRPARNGTMIARGGNIITINGVKVGKENEPEKIEIPFAK